MSSSQYVYGAGVGHLRPMYTSGDLLGVYRQLAQSLSRTDVYMGQTLDEVHARITPKPAYLRGEVVFTAESGKGFEMFDTLFQLKTILKECKEQQIEVINLYNNGGFFRRVT